MEKGQFDQFPDEKNISHFLKLNFWTKWRSGTDWHKKENIYWELFSLYVTTPFSIIFLLKSKLQTSKFITNFSLQFFFWQLFSWNQSCQQLKSPKLQHFHEFFPVKNSIIFFVKSKLQKSKIFTNFSLQFFFDNCSREIEVVNS